MTQACEEERDGDEERHQPPEPKPKERIGPKLGLEAMTWFVMDIVSRGTMLDGRFADEAWITLGPADLEKLTDIADTLDYFRIQRLHARLEQDRRNGRR